MKELLKTIKDCRRKVNGFTIFSLLTIVLICQFTYAERQISQFGITWTFNRDYTLGQFANGDYWILGPVTIISIDPPSTQSNGRTINGSMINPSPKLGSLQGYDSAMYGGYVQRFDPNLNVGRPNNLDLSASNSLVLQPHSSLISTISIPNAGHRPQLKTAAIHCYCWMGLSGFIICASFNNESTCLALDIQGRCCRRFDWLASFYSD